MEVKIKVNDLQSSRSLQMATIRGYLQNFSLLSQFLGPNAACTKFGETKCQIRTPTPRL